MANKYDLIKTDYGRETETDADNNYSISITVALHPTDGIAPDFSKDIVVTSNNRQTGFEVDTQREEAVAAYMEQINS